MNPIEQIKHEIAALQKKVAELEKQPEELTRETGMPKVNGNGFYIRTNGNIEKGIIIFNHGISNLLDMCPDFDKFNSFSTFEEAEAERDYTLASRRVRAWAKAVNGEWKADWNSVNQKKWGVKSVDNYLELDVNHTCNHFIHQICFPTKELAEKFLELFRPELEILAKP